MEYTVVEHFSERNDSRMLAVLNKEVTKVDTDLATTSATGGGFPFLVLATEAALQGKVRAVFEGVLQVSPVSLHDDFFALGGDSILAVSLALEIEACTGLEVSIVDIYEAPTIAALTALLGA